MNKKVWANPEVIDLGVEMTEAGGTNTSNVDKTWLEGDKLVGSFGS